MNDHTSNISTYLARYYFVIITRWFIRKASDFSLNYFIICLTNGIIYFTSYFVFYFNLNSFSFYYVNTTTTK